MCPTGPRPRPTSGSSSREGEYMKALTVYCSLEGGAKRAAEQIAAMPGDVLRKVDIIMEGES